MPTPKVSTQNTPTLTKPNYAFIDSQNLHLGVGQDIYDLQGKLIYKGWRLDLKKFRVYMRNKYNITKAYLFLGYLAQNKAMYQSFKNFGYDLIFKDVIIGHAGQPKGNVDAELVLQSAAVDYQKYDKVVIVTGDGDFKCLVRFLVQRNKFEVLLVPNQFKYSNLLRKPGLGKLVFINRAKSFLEYK